ncbi:TetR/AcrR family transcriptional regulator [Salinisphaera sp. T31B1]|uniref:TetR/AcrR family transcriptional regulator n=1 Tax=Salinisphaera sp. T31B1 TaxID=727963 RepID=UPI00333E6C51
MTEEVITRKKKPRVRDRIFAAACELFYWQGVRAVGVDAIVSAAGTNKMSFYRAFASKDDLVAAYVRQEVEDSLAHWQAILDAHAGDALAQARAFFKAHLTETCAEASRGCPLSNVAVELSETQHPARAIIEEYKSEMRHRFRKLAGEMGTPTPDALGDTLMLLWEGAYLSPLTFHAQRGPAQHVADAAEAVIKAFVPAAQSAAEPAS